MGRIDVSDILDDPDFVDPMDLIHRTATVNELGENTFTERRVCTKGCVQPASGKTLSRVPDEFRIENVMSFWAKATIVADRVGSYSDQIIFKGQRYNVKTVFDWSNWGSGWTEGLCVMERINLG